MEQDEFKRKVLPMREQLYGYAQRLLEDGDDAEDIIQEVLLKLWYMKERLMDYRSIPALSVQITKHLCLNRIKTYGRSRERLDTLVVASDAPSPHAELEQKDHAAQVMKIIDRLPGLQQTILRMRHVDGFEIGEIADLTGSSPEAVRVNLSRARKRVRELVFKKQV